MDEVTDIADAEEQNRIVSVTRLGDTLTLAQDLFEAYVKLGELLQSTKVDDGEWFETVAALMLGVRYQLVTGVLAVLRAHLTDANQSMRRAVELAAVAYRIHGSPKLRELWMGYDPEDDAARRQHNREFRTEALFPETDPLLLRLRARYRTGSAAFHGSVVSLARRISMRTEEGWRVVRGDYFEITDGNRAEPQRSFLYLIDAHHGALQVFSRIFEAQLGSLKPQWELRMNAFAAKYQVHLQRWAPTFGA